MRLFKFIFLFFCLIFSLKFVFAESQFRYDCGLVWKYSKEDVLKKLTESNDYNILNKQEIELAYQHLKNYCCDLDVLKDSECSDKWDNYASSPMLFDHLIDIWFRKLDGDSSVSYTKLDPDWKERFEQKKEIFLQKEWKIPEIIFQKFSSFWKDPSNPSQNGKLLQKYYDLCNDIEKIYTRVPLSLSSDFAKEYLNSELACRKLVSQRYRKEVDLISTIMIKQGKNRLIHNMKKYAKDDFSEDLLMNLFEKFAKFRGYFAVVYSKIVEWTANCSWW